MDKTKIFMALVLMSVVFLSGCAAPSSTGQTTLESQEEVQQVVTNVTDNIGDVQDTLEEIDQTFG